MTYEDSAALMTDSAFHGRVKVACLKFANSIFDSNKETTASYNTLLKWANRCFQLPDQVATDVQPPTVMDGQVQTDGAAITDDLLQTSVETVIKKQL